jgi:hydrogenase maturation protein HypF
MGRLFDAVAALCGRWQEISYEGQAAMELEFAADLACTETYEIPLSPSSTSAAIADWEPMVRQILADRAGGAAMSAIAARFHNALVQLAIDMAAAAGCEQVVLTGGCFQNALLHDRAREGLQAAGHVVYTHRKVPPGDGGIALGQVFVAAQSDPHVPRHSR